MSKYYVYAHFTNDQAEHPFYIGKGTGNRAYTTVGRNSDWLIESQNGYVVKIIQDNMSELEAYELEKNLIQRYGRRDINTGCLVNKTSGGNDNVTDKPIPLKIEQLIKKFTFEKALEDTFLYGSMLWVK